MKYLHSGKCRQCAVGMATGKKDISGADLFTGDIVLLLTNVYGRASEGLTAMTANQYRSVQTIKGATEHHLSEEELEFYVMGIKSIDFESDETWQVWKVKDHKDVIDGEHWPAFGFSYKEE